MNSLSYIPPAVAYAHKARKTIIMAVGEQGLGPAFASAATPQYRTALVNNIVAYVSRYNFDGVDVDWEEEVPQNEADYVALISELRAALDRAFPARHMYLSADVDLGQVPPAIAVKIAPYLDSVNLETFQDNGVSSVTAYTAAGIPSSQLLLGIGVAPGYYDTTEASVAAKARYAEDHGLRGTLLWQPGNLRSYRTDPRLTPLRQMISTTR
jgi:GH18 family chitinase